MSVPSPDLAALRQLGERIRPLTTAGERLLPVPEAVAALMPYGGLQRGTTVSTSGPAATSLALALAGPTTVSGAWMAVVGLDDLGLLAAAELGVALERTLLVSEPPAPAWAATVAALLDAVDVVLVRPGRPVSASTQRRLVARADDRGSVLVNAGGRADLWAEAPDLTVTTTAATWEGVGQGHGRLVARRVAVAVAGRRAATRTRRTDLWLPGPDGRIALAAPAAPVAPAHRQDRSGRSALRETG